MVKHLPGFHNAFFVWLKLIQGTCVDTHKVEPVCWKQEVFHESAVSPAVWSLLWCSYSGLLQKQPNVIIPFIWHVCWGGQSLLLGCRGHLRFYVLYKVIFKEPFLRKFSIMWTWWQKKEKASFINCFTKYSMSVVAFKNPTNLNDHSSETSCSFTGLNNGWTSARDDWKTRVPCGHQFEATTQSHQINK